MSRFRHIASASCGVLGVVLIFAAFLLGYATRSLFNEQAFSSRVAASLEDPRVANFVAEQLADAVIKAKPDLVGLRPVLVGVARSVVTTPRPTPTSTGRSPIRSGLAWITASAICPATYSANGGFSRLAATRSEKAFSLKRVRVA